MPPATTKRTPRTRPPKPPKPQAPRKARPVAEDVVPDRRSQRTLTGTDIRILRTARLGWTTQEFAAFLDVALSAIGRWERCEDRPVVTDRHFYNLLLVLVDVLDRVPGAKDKLCAVRSGGSHRGVYVMFGLYFGDTPWIDEVRTEITPSVRARRKKSR
jgi:hypothetical protein